MAERPRLPLRPSATTTARSTPRGCSPASARRCRWPGPSSRSAPASRSTTGRSPTSSAAPDRRTRCGRTSRPSAAGGSSRACCARTSRSRDLSRRAARHADAGAGPARADRRADAPPRGGRARLGPGGRGRRPAADHEHGLGDPPGGDRGGERRRPALVPALLAERRRARREHGPARRGGRLLGHRPHRRQLPARAGSPATSSRPTSRSSRASGSPSTSPTRSSGRDWRSRRRRTSARRSATSSGSSPTRASPGSDSSGCAARPRSRSSSRGSCTPTTPARPGSAASTGSSSRITAAGRSTGRSPRSTRCRRSSTRSATGWRCCSTAGSAPARTSSRRSRWAPTRSWSAAPTSGGLRSTARPGSRPCSAALLAELDLTMTLSGFTRTAEIDRGVLRRSSGLAARRGRVHRDGAAARVADLDGVAEQPGEPEPPAAQIRSGGGQLAGEDVRDPVAGVGHLDDDLAASVPGPHGRGWSARGPRALVAISLTASDDLLGRASPTARRRWRTTRSVAAPPAGRRARNASPARDRGSGASTVASSRPQKSRGSS